MAKNRVELIGVIGQEPVKREFDNGGVIVTFSIGTTERAWKTKDGKEIPEKTDWHNICCNGGLATIAEKYFHKGDKIYIEGKLRNRQYEKNGEKRTFTEIVATGFEFMQNKKKEDNNQQEQQMFPPPQSFDDEKIPF